LFSESYWTLSEQVKNDHFKGGVDGFSYFSLISVILTSITPDIEHHSFDFVLFESPLNIIIDLLQRMPLIESWLILYKKWKSWN